MLPPADAGLRLFGNRRGSIDEVRLGLHEYTAIGLTEGDGCPGAVEILGDQLQRGAGQKRRASRGCIIPACCEQRFRHFAIAGMKLERTVIAAAAAAGGYRSGRRPQVPMVCRSGRTDGSRSH